MKPTEWIWRDREFVRWADATLHVTAHALHYGSAVFEGIRAYATPRGPKFFRLRDHLRRLRDSAAIYHMPLDHDEETLAQACKELLRKNRMPHAYVRPLVVRGAGPLSLDPSPCPVETFVLAWEWGKYLTAATAAVGITRDTMLNLAQQLGLPTAEERIPRERLYVADEVFLCGTAAEITPVRSIDRVTIGSGQPGPVTQALQRAFHGLFDDTTEDRHGWLEPVAGG